MAVLVDTSVWVQHFRRGVPELLPLLAASEVTSHAVVVGELAVGGLPNRPRTMADLRALPRVPELPADDVFDFLDRHGLFNIGLSWGDAELLAAAVTSGVPLWSLDARLHAQAQAFGVAWTPPIP